MLSVSLPFEWLSTGIGVLGDVDPLLKTLKEQGVKSIELRTVLLRHTPEEVLRVAELLWEKGFRISVHVKAHSAEQAVSEVFDPLSLVLAHLRQDRLVAVLHPIKGDNAALLQSLADHRDAHGYPLTIALENNRLLPDHSEGDCAALVLDAVQKADRQEVGICFDMGHYAYFCKKNLPEGAFRMPDKDFFSRVVHTHIHALKGLKTHFPLDQYELPLKEILSRLGRGYFGVYNIELDFPRFVDEIPGLSAALCRSVEHLKATLPPCALLYDRIRREYDADLARALTVLEKKKGCFFSLLSSSSYLFCTNGYRWAMDPSFRFAYKLAKAPQNVGALFRDVQLILLTHDHADHFEEETVRRLAENETHWVVPDFLVERALACGIRPTHMTVAHASDVLQVGPLTLRVFEGRHFRPENKKGTRAYGYHISAKGQPSLVFPVDVRDYSVEDLPNLPDADYCFAHVWLGDKSANAADYGDLPARFAAFMLRFSRKNLILTHLYESARKDEDMWRREHALLLADAIRGICPSAATHVPAWGEVMELIP